VKLARELALGQLPIMAATRAWLCQSRRSSADARANLSLSAFNAQVGFIPCSVITLEGAEGRWSCTLSLNTKPLTWSGAQMK